MLTIREKRNIANFSQLSPEYRSILRWRLKRKCNKTIKDLCFLMAHSSIIGLTSNELIDLNDFIELLDIYQLSYGLPKTVKNKK